MQSVSLCQARIEQQRDQRAHDCRERKTHRPARRLLERAAQFAPVEADLDAAQHDDPGGLREQLHVGQARRDDQAAGQQRVQAAHRFRLRRPPEAGQIHSEKDIEGGVGPRRGPDLQLGAHGAVIAEHRPRSEAGGAREREIHRIVGAAPPARCRLCRGDHRRRRTRQHHQQHQRQETNSATRMAFARSRQSSEPGSGLHQDRRRDDQCRNLCAGMLPAPGRRREQHDERNQAAVPGKRGAAGQFSPGHLPRTQCRHALRVPGPGTHFIAHASGRSAHSPYAEESGGDPCGRRGHAVPGVVAHRVDQRQHQGERHRQGHQPVRREFEPQIAAKFRVHCRSRTVRR